MVVEVEGRPYFTGVRPPVHCRPIYDICEYPFEVHQFNGANTRLLDSGRAIRPKSLKLHGAKLCWINGKRHRSATLR